MKKKLIKDGPEDMGHMGGNRGVRISKNEFMQRIEESVEKGEYKEALLLFRSGIIGIMCEERVLDVCSPYYFRGGRIKEDAGSVQERARLWECMSHGRQGAALLRFMRNSKFKHCLGQTSGHLTGGFQAEKRALFELP